MKKIFLLFCLLLCFLAGCSDDSIDKSKIFTITWKNYDGTFLEIDKNVSPIKENTKSFSSP